MTNYRRNRVSGGCYFFTVALLDRRSSLLVDQAEMLRQAVRGVRTARPFAIDAWVVLPDHMHMIWTLPEGDDDFSTRMRLMKTAFSRTVCRGEGLSQSRAMKKERGIWQRRFWEHTIRDDADYVTHMDYIHFNPVKHGLVEAADDWPLSTFRRSVARGLYPKDWIGFAEQNLEVGERFDCGMG